MEPDQERRSEGELKRARAELNAQAANGSFGQADGNNNELLFQGTGRGNTGATGESLRSRLINLKDSKASQDAKRLMASEHPEVAYLKNIPEIEDNLSNKVINLNHSPQ